VNPPQGLDTNYSSDSKPSFPAACAPRIKKAREAFIIDPIHFYHKTATETEPFSAEQEWIEIHHLRSLEREVIHAVLRTPWMLKVIKSLRAKTLKPSRFWKNYFQEENPDPTLKILAIDQFMDLLKSGPEVSDDVLLPVWRDLHLSLAFLADNILIPLATAHRIADASSSPVATSEVYKLYLLHREKIEAMSAQRHRFAEANLRIVMSFAKAYHFSRNRNGGISIIDLIGYGNQGLMRAIDLFESNKNFKFITFARWWILRFMQIGARHQKVIRIPDERIADLSAMSRFRTDFYNLHGFWPDMKVTAEALGKKEGLLWDLMRAGNVQSTNRPLSKQSSRRAFSREDTLSLSSETREPLTGQQAYELEDMLSAYIDRLIDPRSQEILSLRFGLGGQNPRKISEVASLYGISAFFISVIEAHALKQLKFLIFSDANVLSDLEKRVLNVMYGPTAKPKERRVRYKSAAKKLKMSAEKVEQIEAEAFKKPVPFAVR